MLYPPAHAPHQTVIIDEPPRPTREQLDRYARALIRTIDEKDTNGLRMLKAAAYTDSEQRSIYMDVLERLKANRTRLPTALHGKAYEIVERAIEPSFDRINPQSGREAQYIAEVRDALKVFEPPTGPLVTERNLSEYISKTLLQRIKETLSEDFQTAEQQMHESLLPQYAILRRVGADAGDIARAEQADLAAIRRVLNDVLLHGKRESDSLAAPLYNSVGAANRALALDQNTSHPLPYVAADATLFPESKPASRIPSSAYREALPADLKKKYQAGKNEVSRGAAFDEIIPRTPTQAIALTSLAARAGLHLDSWWMTLLASAFMLTDPVSAASYAYCRAGRRYDIKVRDFDVDARLRDARTELGKTRERLEKRDGIRWRVAFERWATHPRSIPTVTAFQTARAVRSQLRRALLIEPEIHAPVIPDPAIRNARPTEHESEVRGFWEQANNERMEQVQALFDSETVAIEKHLRDVESLLPADRKSDLIGIRCLSCLDTDNADGDELVYSEKLQSRPRVTDRNELERRIEAAFV